MQTLESHHTDPPPMPVGQISVPVYEPPEVMTPKQAARFLQVDEEKLLALAAEGHVPGRRVGDDWRFARAALIEWLSGPDGPQD
jgi:excisionase family DNA binding protein